jgi:hypothetical protein
MICRFCRKDDRPLVKYGVRHHAHGRCLLLKRAPHPAQRADVERVLDSISLTALNDFAPLLDFDQPEVVGTFAAIGMTVRQFMDYYNKRRKREAAR